MRLVHARKFGKKVTGVPKTTYPPEELLNPNSSKRLNADTGSPERKGIKSNTVDDLFTSLEK